jgi:crotonobetainyl-CoA:carnitine CoA-transferase CaiB-like acyl-CoA transferase
VTGDTKPSFGPLDGVRIIDLTIALAGAFSTMLLADLGAEIIKVESVQHYPTPTKGPRNPPRGIDEVAMSTARDYPDNDPGPDPWNRLSWFNSHARNKRDVTVDITRTRGRELFLRLVERSDGLIENNAAGLLDKLGIGTDVLHQVNAALIIVQMPPLGVWGPDSSATGFGWHFEDLGGFLRVQGYPEGPEVGSIFMDGASGPGGANAFLMGLLQRRRTGRGAVCELAQVENMICHIGDLTLEAAMHHQTPRRWGNRSPDFAPQGCYPCAGEDSWVVLSIRSDEEWHRLRRLLGDPTSLQRSDFGTLAGRLAAHDEIDEAIATWTRTRSPMEATEALQDVGVPAGPVLTEGDASSDPQLHERGFFQLLDHPSCGTHFHAAANFRLDGTPPQLWRAAPTLGQDNEYVYRDILGLSDQEYGQLVAEGHIGTEYL